MRILIGGDFVIQNRCMDMVNQENYSFLDNLKHLFDKSDFNIINLEAPITTDSSKSILKVGPNLHNPKQTLEVLKNIGVTNVTLANNHILDYGESALENTIKQLKTNLIDIVGAAMTPKDAAVPMILCKGAIKVGVLNFCETEFSIVSDQTGGANPLNCIAIYNSIKELRGNVDYVIIITHSGHENFHLPSMKMVEESRYMIDLGADLVVNHHQHCVSGIEEYKGKYIYYGIGNLCFDKLDKVNSSWYDGMLVCVDIDKYSLSSSYVIFKWCENPFRIEISPSIEERIQKDIKTYSSVISEPANHKKQLNDYYSLRKKGILSTFQPYNNRVLNKLYRLNLLPSFITKRKFLKILNLIECDSHRTATINSLRSKIYNR